MLPRIYTIIMLAGWLAGERRDHNAAETLGGPRHRDSAGSVINRSCYVIGQVYWTLVSPTVIGIFLS